MSGNKKKVVIKPWRPQSQWNRAKAEQTMEALRQAINEIHNQNASLLSFEELYRNAYYLVLHKYGRMLYDGIGGQIAAHLQDTVKAIVAAPDDMLLAAVKRDWGAHTINMEMIRDILMYMDRTFVLKENLTKVYDLGLKTFRREVLHHKQVQNRLVKQILANIHSERWVSSSIMRSSKTSLTCWCILGSIPGRYTSTSSRDRSFATRHSSTPKSQRILYMKTRALPTSQRRTRA